MSNDLATVFVEQEPELEEFEITLTDLSEQKIVKVHAILSDFSKWIDEII